MRRESRAQEFHHPVEGVGPVLLSGGLDEGGPQGGEPRHDLSTCPFRPIASALARDTGLLQPFGLLFEPRGPLQVLGVGLEVIADGPCCPELQSRRSGVPGVASSSGVQASQRFLQAPWSEGLKEKAEPRRSETR